MQSRVSVVVLLGFGNRYFLLKPFQAMPHREALKGKVSINVKLKQDADKTSERLVLEGASKRCLIFPLPKPGLTVCKTSAMEATEFGQI